MRRWSRPLCYVLEKSTADAVVWKVRWSNGVRLVGLGEARRVRVEHGPPKFGKSWAWVPYPEGASAPLTGKPSATLGAAGQELLKHWQKEKKE